LSAPLRIGIDTGGTFTDFVIARGARLTSFKVSSTPHNPAQAILEGLARVIAEGGDSPTEIVHGTTVATNALLERKGARTALITTAGFEDVIEIGRQARPELYNLMVTRPAPLVARELRFGLDERTGPNGETLTPLDVAGLEEIVSNLHHATPPVESVAVCLLFSFANPAHEQTIASALAALNIPVSLSHKILPEYREYERTSTTVINAYLVPLMSRYLGSLMSGLGGVAPGPISLRVMQSNGGSVSAVTAASEPVRAILSGPAGGVVGALRAAAAAGIRDIITFDMGGTSTDVALCRGEARTTNEALVAGLPVAVPIIDIHTVGAGGGSIARVDAAGALRVGPESAGADPGPACYGRGDAVTVTDANLVLGRFGGADLLGGAMTLDVERSRAALKRLAAAMSRHSARRVSIERAALGVVRVANANMEAALRVVSVERGQDPRLFTMVSFGGAGGLHVCALAEALRIPRVFIPRSPGTLSALGVLLGDVVKDYSRTVMLKTATGERRLLEKAFAQLEREAATDLKREGFAADRIRLARSVAMRYVGQSFEIEVAWSSRFESRFHAAHRERYGYADAARATEIVSLRVRATGVTDKPRLPRSSTRQRKAAPRHTADVYLAERAERVPVYAREDFNAGMKLQGPAIITEYSSTTLIPARQTVAVDEWLNLIVTWPGKASAGHREKM
jgi:N-methylhydantoinase A